MTIPPIFKFKNVKTRLTTTDPTFIYGVVAGNGDSSLDTGISPNDVTAVVLTVQISHYNTSNVAVTSWVSNSATSASLSSDARVLVYNYPIIAYNAFDPLSGNLVLAANDQLWVQASIANYCDVIVSVLEIANATAS